MSPFRLPSVLTGSLRNTPESASPHYRVTLRTLSCNNYRKTNWDVQRVFYSRQVWSVLLPLDLGDLDSKTQNHPKPEFCRTARTIINPFLTYNFRTGSWFNSMLPPGARSAPAKNPDFYLICKIFSFGLPYWYFYRTSCTCENFRLISRWNLLNP